MFRTPFQCMNIYIVWSETVASKFRTSADPKESALAFVSGAGNLELELQLTSPFALGMVTSIGREICEKWNIIEAFIDSTYKTNST